MQQLRSGFCRERNPLFRLQRPVHGLMVPVMITNSSVRVRSRSGCFAATALFAFRLPNELSCDLSVGSTGNLIRTKKLTTIRHRSQDCCQTEMNRLPLIGKTRLCLSWGIDWVICSDLLEAFSAIARLTQERPDAGFGNWSLSSPGFCLSWDFP